jgi:hypothetical protein
MVVSLRYRSSQEGRVSPTFRSFVYVCARALLLSFLPSVAWGAGPSNTQPIADVSVQANGLILVAAQNGSWGNPDACTNDERFVLAPQLPARKELVALVLSAHLQGRSIRAFFSDCTPVGSGSVTFPNAVSIKLF